MSPKRPRDPLVDDEWFSIYKRALGGKRGAAADLAKELNVSPGALSKLKTQGSAWLVFKISRHLRIPPPRALLDRAQYELLAELEGFRRQVDARYHHKQPKARSEIIEGESLGVARQFQAMTEQRVESLATGKSGKIANSNLE